MAKIKNYKVLKDQLMNLKKINKKLKKIIAKDDYKNNFRFCPKKIYYQYDRSQINKMKRAKKNSL